MPRGERPSETEANRWKETVKCWWKMGSTWESPGVTHLTVALLEALVPRLFPSLPRAALVSSPFMRAGKFLLCLGQCELSFCCLHWRVLGDMVLFPHSPTPTGQAANESKGGWFPSRPAAPPPVERGHPMHFLVSMWALGAVRVTLKKHRAMTPSKIQVNCKQHNEWKLLCLWCLYPKRHQFPSLESHSFGLGLLLKYKLGECSGGSKSANLPKNLYTWMHQIH